jgi:cell division protein FtsA
MLNLFNKEAEGKVIVALEVGTNKVAAAVAELKPDHSVVLLGVGEAPSRGLRKGEIVDFQLAQQSILQALADAEQKTDAEIREVYLVLTGTHIESSNTLVRTNIIEEEKIVLIDHLEELDEMADSHPIPADSVPIHKVLQHYYLDNKLSCGEPIGLNSESLEAGYHLVYGMKTRLETTVRCIAELNINVVGYALASYVTAQAILRPEQKRLGSVVIDMGAGVTDYCVYADGVIIHSGVLGVGGDHLTHDLALGLKIPFQKAEDLKLKSGDLYMTDYDENEEITLEQDVSFEERRFFRETMIQIMHVRQREILELIEQDIERQGLWSKITAGVFITGGASRVKGLVDMAEEVFRERVNLIHEFPFEGSQMYNKRPELSTALGMLRYAQYHESKVVRPKGLSRITASLKSALAALGLL